ncbi:hypothetical protein ABID42_002259 [Arcicella rosea]|uniref:KAP family P-loop NTPase fold protein n=1 Tax=Arcicella rosea TaxID=502909 RepID=UPI00345DF544
MWADNETSEDLLGFRIHADLLIDVINDETILPVTIGVFGDWGSGKSSILQMIKEKFEEKKEGDESEFKDMETLCIYFNGWTFEGYDDAKAALLNTIVDGLEDNAKLSEEIKKTVKEKAKKLWASIDWMRGAGMVMKNIALPAVSAYFSGGISLLPFAHQKITELGLNSPAKLIEKLQSKEGKEFFESLQKKEVIEKKKTNAVADFKNDFEELLKSTPFKKLVVIIDDLDRCTPDRIIENLEAVKLFLNVPKTAFIIGADPRIVRHAIVQKYKESNQIIEDNNRIIDDYLEKLIQIPYSLPKLSEPEVETYISMLICKKEIENSKFQNIYFQFQQFRLSDRYSAFGLLNFESILEKKDYDKIKSNVITVPSLVPLITNSLYGNPRQIKRFLNTYTLRKRLAGVAVLKDFNDSVLAKLMILEYSELKLFRELFELQSNQDGFPSLIKEIEKICVGKLLDDAHKDLENSDFREWAKPKLIKWIQSEPKLSSVDLRDYFWISRDKISTSILASSLIPPIVKALFNELEKEIPATATRKIIKEKFIAFTEIEKNSFFQMLSSSLKQNPKQKRYYEIFNYMIEEKIENSAYQYIEVLKVIRESDIDPSIAHRLSSYKSEPTLSDFLNDYFKNSNSKPAKAFNLKNNK